MSEEQADGQHLTTVQTALAPQRVHPGLRLMALVERPPRWPEERRPFTPLPLRPSTAAELRVAPQPVAPQAVAQLVGLRLKQPPTMWRPARASRDTMGSITRPRLWWWITGVSGTLQRTVLTTRSTPSTSPKTSRGKMAVACGSSNIRQAPLQAAACRPTAHGNILVRMMDPARQNTQILWPDLARTHMRHVPLPPMLVLYELAVL